MGAINSMLSALTISHAGFFCIEDEWVTVDNTGIVAKNIKGNIAPGFSLDTNRNTVDGLVQSCSNSTAIAVELPQSCTKTSMYCLQNPGVFNGFC